MSGYQYLMSPLLYIGTHKKWKKRSYRDEKEHEKMEIISYAQFVILYKKSYFESKNNIISMNLNLSNNYCLYSSKTEDFF